MKYLLLSLSILVLGCFSCTRKVTCQSCALSFSTIGFDSTEIMSATVERYTTDAFDHLASRDTVTVTDMYLLDVDSPAKGYRAEVFHTMGGNYKIRVGNTVTTRSDIQYDEETEKQGWGMGDYDPCYNKVHFTLNGTPDWVKPTSNGPIYLEISK